MSTGLRIYTTTALTLAFATSAAAAPSAAAGTSTVARPGAGAAATRSASGVARGPISPTVVRVLTPDHGFHWGDAGIGAAGGIGLSMLAVGGALAFSQLRGRPATRPTTTTN